MLKWKDQRYRLHHRGSPALPNPILTFPAGTHNAMKTGMIAAESAFDAIANGKDVHLDSGYVLGHWVSGLGQLPLFCFVIPGFCLV